MWTDKAAGLEGRASMVKGSGSRAAPCSVAATVALAGLAACGAPSGDDVASLGSAAASPSPSKPAQRLAAEEYYSCLIADDVPADITDAMSGQARVDFQEGTGLVRFRNPGQHGAGWYGPGDAPAGLDFNSSEFDAKHPDGAFGFEIDGVDFSEAYGECHTSSGYSEPLGIFDPAEELLAKQIMTDTTNTWIARARRNGFPELDDLAQAAADSWATVPWIYLPLTTTDA
jgi:hypothetical protein